MIKLKKRKPVLGAGFAVIMLALTTGFLLAGEGSGQMVESQVEPRKFLVLDSRIIERVQNAKLTLGEVNSTLSHYQTGLLSRVYGDSRRFEAMFSLLESVGADLRESASLLKTPIFGTSLIN